ncbi:MAG: magnesium transporter [Tepidisphaera sp.]|nr:magnesium transporter [Tepidisphaera sp.]
MNPTAELLRPEVEELIKEQRYSELREALHLVHPADIAEILSSLDASEAAVGFRFLQRDDAAAAFAYMPPEVQETLIDKLGDEQAASVIEAMSPDDRARLVDELPEECATRIVASLSPEKRQVTQAILGYPERSVGRLMTPDYVRVRPDWTVAKALDHIRKYGKDAETINVIYVVDNEGRLIDDMRLRQLLLSDPESTIESLMNRSFVTLRADQPQEEAVALMARYDRTALPVVDSRGLLIGIVTSDDVADVAQQEATEDMQKMGAVGALEEPYDKASIWSLVRKRAPWLSLLFVSELLTSNALQYFDTQIEKLAVLAAFVPAIISSGGNSGSQASTLVIRAMALGEIGLRDWFRVLRRELLTSAILALMIGVLGFCRISLWGLMGLWAHPKIDDTTKQIVLDEAGHKVYDYTVQHHYPILALAIATSLVGVVVWGSIMGAMLPFVLKRFGLDPAGSSTPFVATLVDVTGIIIYFTCAMTILHGTLL